MSDFGAALCRILPGLIACIVAYRMQRPIVKVQAHFEAFNPTKEQERGTILVTIKNFGPTVAHINGMSVYVGKKDSVIIRGVKRPVSTKGQETISLSVEDLLGKLSPDVDHDFDKVRIAIGLEDGRTIKAKDTCMVSDLLYW